MSDLFRGQFKNEVIRASAGTGKTFELSNRFLRLLASGAKCESILATTFTRKGAGEILDRIVQRLANAADSPTAASELAEQLEWQLDQKRAQALLRDLMRNLHRLQIGTLDAFFYRIAQVFRLELNLPTEWNIASEQQIGLLQNRAIRDILRKQSVIDLLHLLTGGDAGRRVADLIRSTVDHLYEIFVDSDAAAWDRLPDCTSFNPDQSFDAVCDQLRAINYPHGSQKNKIDQEIELIQQRQWLDLASSSIARAIAAGSNKYYKPLPDACVTAYQPIIEHCRNYLIDMLSRRNRSTYALLEEFGRNLENTKKERGELRFDDVTRELVEFIAGKDTRDFSFRLDHEINHLLLDEFQDTSIDQWKVIKPFALRTTADDSEKSFFCVGDLKQAIFGWRGGVAEIFDLVEEDLTNMSDARQLTTSYRSSPTVIDVVNQVFQNLDRYKSNDEVVNSAVADWATRFTTHATAKTELPGYCTLEYAAESVDKQDPARNDNVLVATVDRVRRLHEAMPDRSIGVLLRKNETIGQLIYMLRDAGIPASEEGGNPLTDSAAVEAVISAMTLADHHGDSVARFHLSHSPLAVYFGLVPEYKNNQDENIKAAWAAAESIRRDLSLHGYGPTIEKMASILASHCTVRELSRLQQLVQEAFNYDTSHGEVSIKLRPARFVNFIRDEFKASDESSAQIRVMTVHQSKGLEFDIVVLPMLSSKRGWFVQNSQVIVGRPSPTDPIDLVSRLVNENHRSLLPSEFQHAYDENRRREVFDNLCVLYVAMTRAIHATHVVMSFGCKADSQSGAGILLSTLIPGWKKEDRSEGAIYEHGDQDWHSHMAPEQTLKGSPEQRAFYLPSDAKLSVARLSTASKSGRGIPRVSPSNLEGGATVQIKSIFSSLSNSQQLRRGTLIHACFEQVRWLDESRPDHQALATTLSSIGAKAEEIEQIAGAFNQMVEQPKIIQLLTRQSYLQSCTPDLSTIGSTIFDALRVEVANERAFALIIDDQLMQGTVDRLVFVYEADKLIAADIIDYKTDQVDEKNINERVKYYAPQLQAYRQSVSQVFQLDEKRVSTRLAFVELGIVVDVDASTGSFDKKQSAEPTSKSRPHINQQPSNQDKTQMKLWGEK